MSRQTQSGKAFEYALINEANKILSTKCIVDIVKDRSYEKALSSYKLFSSNEQERYGQAALAALNHIITLEPKLTSLSSDSDILSLQLQADSEGIKGDVRDVLFLRSNQHWEIGISAKNNHKALKHPRLSKVKDFGNSWIGIPCSEFYFETIVPIFLQLEALKTESILWRALPNKYTDFYQPILNAFREELTLIYSNNENVPQNLITYLEVMIFIK